MKRIKTQIPEATRLSLAHPMPKKSSTRLDDLLSIMIWGFDIKITPDDHPHPNTPHIIEINGLNTGMRGFSLVGEKGERDLNRYLCEQYQPLELLSLTYQLHHLFPWRFLGLVRGNVEQSKKTIKESESMFQEIRDYHHELYHISWYNHHYLLGHQTRILDSMITTNHLLDRLMEPQGPELRKPKSYRMDEPKDQKAINSLNQDQLAVMKPLHSVGGRQISIGSIGKLSTYRQDQKPWILEPFIPSKPLKSQRTKEMHDGCMRYVVLAEQHRDLSVNLHHFGGYWRLAARPLQDSPHQLALMSNLRSDGYAEPAASEDLALVKQGVDTFLRRIYQKSPRQHHLGIQYLRRGELQI